MSEIKYEIKEHIAELAPRNQKGWTKELNLISWNDAAAVFDIRSWSENHEKMGKGITLSQDEAKSLIGALSSYLKGDSLDFSREEP